MFLTNYFYQCINLWRWDAVSMFGVLYKKFSGFWRWLYLKYWWVQLGKPPCRLLHSVKIRSIPFFKNFFTIEFYLIDHLIFFALHIMYLIYLNFQYHFVNYLTKQDCTNLKIQKQQIIFFFRNKYLIYCLYLK